MRVGLFSRKPMGGGFADAIRCDESSYLIWKWHPQGTNEGNNRKENSIRWGSSLRVKEGSVAVFVYSQKNGTVQEYIEGPFDEILQTKNLPIISNIIGLAYAGNAPFPAEVYFINLARIIQIKFAVPYFDVFDPRFLDFGVPVAVRGTISFKITDYKDFVKLLRLDTFTVDDFQNQIKSAISRYIKTVITKAPEEYGIPIVQIERKLEEINEVVEAKIKGRLYDEFGVTVSSIDIAVIDVDKTSEGYRQLKEVTQDLTVRTMTEKNEVEIQEMRDTQKLGVLERAGKINVNIKEDAYARHKQTQSANLETYQIEAQEHIGVAGAHVIGLMGMHGGSTIGGGMNPASMMAGIAVGGAIGQNIAGTINKMMSPQQKKQEQSENKATIPNSSNYMYNIVMDGKAAGPYDMATLTKMYTAGTFLKESLVWTAGMPNWQKAEDVDNLKALFSMPPIPQNY